MNTSNPKSDPSSGPDSGTNASPSPAMALVRAYLDAMEARDLPLARSKLGAGFSMLFPGAVKLDSLEALVEWSKPRYQFVRKTYERYDEGSSPDAPEERIVYCFGTLSGRWLDGRDFAGIRFIDRFVVRNGQLVDQKVWNDMGEHRGAAHTSM